MGYANIKRSLSTNICGGRLKNRRTLWCVTRRATDIVRRDCYFDDLSSSNIILTTATAKRKGEVDGTITFQKPDIS